MIIHMLVGSVADTKKLFINLHIIYSPLCRREN